MSTNSRWCNNCGQYKQCVYRGIINPCGDWEPNKKNGVLRQRAIEIKDKPMSFKEAQFVDSCTTLIQFSPGQESWFMSIYKRVA